MRKTKTDRPVPINLFSYQHKMPKKSKIDMLMDAHIYAYISKSGGCYLDKEIWNREFRKCLLENGYSEKQINHYLKIKA